jgi:L-histidine N-alpha-methyltransferase
LRADARAGLTASPKVLPPKWFYDEEGCRLFDEITRLPEYYPTRSERVILARHALDIAARTSADTLVELGSGTSEKTRLLLDASAIELDYPGVDVHAVVGDFERHLDRLPGGGTRLVAFLGSTIGNLDPDGRARFYRSIAAGLAPDDALLLGTDLVKDPRRLEAAYDDSAGVTAAFNRNVLSVLNRELAADFAPERFAHIARWNQAEEWIEMRLRSQGTQTVRVQELDLQVEFADGEDMRTEISAKFRRERVEAELAAAGLALAAWWTDPGGDFALSLSVPAHARNVR